MKRNVHEEEEGTAAMKAFCSACEHQVELQVLSLDAGASCPRCGADELEPVSSTIAVDGGSGGKLVGREEFSHRLRTPLTVVKGSLQHLIKHWDTLADRDRKVLVKALLGQADQVIAVVEELEDRLSAGEPRETVELDERARG